MKKLFLLVLIFLPLIGLNAQSAGSVKWIAKFGAAGGFTPLVFFPNYDALNNQLPGFGVDKLNGSLITFGGGGYAYTMLVDNLRIGGLGFGGSKSVKNSLNGIDRQVDYSFGGGAFTIEYTFPFIKKIAVSIGAMIGGGSLEVDVYSNDGNFDWNNLWNGINNNQSDNKNVSKHLKNSFFSLAPTINVDVPINRFMALRIGSGYLINVGSTWKIDNDRVLNNVPSGLNGNSFFIQTGVFLGFFAF